MTQTQLPTRTRTFSWSDPSLSSEKVGAMSGLSFLRAITAGDLPAPPISRMLGMGRIDAEEGEVVVHLEPEEYHYNPLGTMHGGVMATLLDTATGCAVHSTLPAGYGYTCAAIEDREVRCWGKNDYGELGRGHTEAIGDDEPPTAGEPIAFPSVAEAR